MYKPLHLGVASSSGVKGEETGEGGGFDWLL